jgi:hypothetical protein
MSTQSAFLLVVPRESEAAQGYRIVRFFARNGTALIGSESISSDAVQQIGACAK